MSIPIPINNHETHGNIHSSSRHHINGTFGSTGPSANKYLFFITDKFVSEKEIEEKQQLKHKRKLDF